MSNCNCKNCRQRNGTYDPQCMYLAVTFMSDYPKLDNQKNRERLAIRIQDAIESELEQMGWDYDELLKPENSRWHP